LAEGHEFAALGPRVISSDPFPLLRADGADQTANGFHELKSTCSAEKSPVRLEFAGGNIGGAGHLISTSARLVFAGSNFLRSEIRPVPGLAGKICRV